MISGIYFPIYINGSVMTRIKEPAIGTSELPEYKSPPSRIVRSLRKGYDNVREKLANKSDTILSLQGKLRDTKESRDDWKSRAKAAEAKLSEIQRQQEKQQDDLKKRM
jgi:predicted  nucleic acid-binding Zn-ribbon protein